MLRLGTVFSGIGAIEQALKRLGIQHEVVFACDNGDIDVPLFDEDMQRRYDELRVKRNKRATTDEEEQELNWFWDEYGKKSDEVREYVYNLPTKQEKIDYVDSLYAKTGKINYVKKSYLSNYTNVKDFHQDIRFLDGEDYENQIDLLVGGSPCQSFSTVGTQDGLNDVRGTLFYEFARIVKETKPKVFIYENVQNLLSHDDGKTWKTISNVFTNVLDYRIAEPKVLNAVDYGIPQN